jgi:hypothetical protein
VPPAAGGFPISIAAAMLGGGSLRTTKPGDSSSRCATIDAARGSAPWICVGAHNPRAQAGLRHGIPAKSGDGRPAGLVEGRRGGGAGEEVACSACGEEEV